MSHWGSVMSSRLDPVRLSSRTRRRRAWLSLGLVGTILAGLAALTSSAVYKVREAGARSA
jgi:hypothetical protein